MGKKIAVIGNPNCGKTTLFNGLTGSTQQVGNWPGVTVEKKIGTFQQEGQTYTLVDLPGIYMIGGVSQGSEDERVARDYLLSGEVGLILNIIDGYNLERNLYLTSQLLEMKIPMVIAVNMIDLAEKSGAKIDVAELARVLDCPVVPIVASRRQGLTELKQALATALATPAIPQASPRHADAVTAAIAELAPALAPAATRRGIAPEWVALKLLEGDNFADTLAAGRLDQALAWHSQHIEQSCGDENDIIIADGRYRFIAEIMAAGLHRPRQVSLALTRRLDAIVLNRFLGVPIFLLAMYLMFLFTINIGGAFVDVFDQAAGAVLVDGLGEVLAALSVPAWLVVVLQGVGRGIQTVTTFIPIIACLFLFLSFLEDSGYMARAAFVMDRAMRAIGLPGKSFVPLIVGFGCNVPAVMATRTLEQRRDRVLTMLMAPFMSCGARLPVFALFAAAFFPSNGQNVVFGLYLIGLAFAVFTGLVLKATLLRGEASHFVLELPPYHLPTLTTVGRQAWQRLREFLFRAGQVIVPMVMILSFFGAMGTDGTFDKANGRDSVLAIASQAIVPMFRPMGLDEENWPAAVGLFTGVFAKEAVVGTLNALYAQADAEATAAGAAGAAADLGDKLLAALATVPENLSQLADKLLDPLGINITYTGEAESAAEVLEVEAGVFGAMVSRFAGAAGAFAYMLLILLYTPCVAVLGTIRHEVGLGWSAFAAGWTGLLGYVASVSFYQVATFADHPLESVVSLAIGGSVLLAVVLGLWGIGRIQGRPAVIPQPAE